MEVFQQISLSQCKIRSNILCFVLSQVDDLVVASQKNIFTVKHLQSTYYLSYCQSLLFDVFSVQRYSEDNTINPDIRQESFIYNNKSKPSAKISAKFSTNQIKTGRTSVWAPRAKGWSQRLQLSVGARKGPRSVLLFQSLINKHRTMIFPTS